MHAELGSGAFRLRRDDAGSELSVAPLDRRPWPCLTPTR